MAESEDTTLFDKTKRVLLNNKPYVIFAVAALVVATASQFLKSVEDIIAGLATDKRRLTMLVTVKEERCNAFLLAFGDIQQASTIDIGLNNNTEGNLMLTSVKLVPEWITAGFFAGQLAPSAQYEVSLAEWYEMAEVSGSLYRVLALTKSAPDDKEIKAMVEEETKRFGNWCSPRYGSLCSRGVEGLIATGKARVKKDSDDDFDSGIWWVKPEPIEIKDIPGNKYTINKGAAERIVIHLGLKRSLDYLIGTVRIAVTTDAGDTIKSEPVKISICTQ
jgi:hypothetical protein